MLGNVILIKAFRRLCVCVFCMDLGTNSNFSLYSINRLDFMTEMESVYSAVRTELLNRVARKERMFFQVIVTLFIFKIKKNHVNTKTSCNKCSFDYLHWLLNYGKLYRKDGVLLAVHTAGASPHSSASHLLTFLVAQLQFLREWKLSDRQTVRGFRT